MWGEHCWRIWSSTQGAVVLSSVEAEFYAMVDGVQKSIWVGAVGRELGFMADGCDVVLGTDSKAAQGFLARRGLGRMHHVEVRDLWLQEQVRIERVKVIKIKWRRKSS